MEVEKEYFDIMLAMINLTNACLLFDMKGAEDVRLEKEN